MLRHTGRRRSYKHNLQLAILLCLTAGFINAAGFIAFAVLTTNVTGHAALLAVNIAEQNAHATRVVALWLILFLAGAFISGLYIKAVGRDRRLGYSVPILVIIAIVGMVALFGQTYDKSTPETEFFAGSLLFAMGMQNALVSVVSGFVVRTTHLTGMFTDLGIDLSEAVLTKGKLTQALKLRMLLRFIIITCFLSGGILGGFCFLHVGFAAFFIPVVLLLITLFYDYFRIQVKKAIANRSTRQEVTSKN